MIKDGNYKYLDWNIYRPNLIEAFVKYYGQEYRERITSKINMTNIISVTSTDYVQDYYNEFMLSQECDVIDKFFEITNLPKTPEIIDIIRKNDMYNSIIETALSGPIDIDNSCFGDGYKKTIKDARKSCYDALGIDARDDSMKSSFYKLRHYYQCYESAVKEIEDKFDTDVISDIRLLDHKNISGFREYIHSCEKTGIYISDSDKKLINDERFSLIDLHRLDCNRILFSDDLSIGGAIEYFSSDNDKFLNYLPEDEKRYVISNRLEYLYYVGMCPKYIDGRLLYDSSIPMNVLIKEYNYQYKKAKSFNLVPSEELVEYIAGARQNIIERCRDGLLCLENIDKSQYSDYISNNMDSKYLQYDFNRDGDLSKTEFVIVISEDNNIDESEFTEAVIHELNHVIGINILGDIKDNACIEKRGLEIAKKLINDYGIVEFQNYSIFDDVFLNLDENIAERMAQEIYEIYFELFGNDIKFDDDLNLPKKHLGCGYTDYNFITENFYNKYKEYIKKHYIDPSYSMYFNSENPSMVKSKILCNLINLKNKILFPRKYYSDGKVDYLKLAEMGILVDIYDELYKDAVVQSELSSSQLLENENANPKLSKKLQEVNKKARKIDEKMDRDFDRTI